jgi:osmotically inducible lipoprotein OsmB
LNTSRHDQVALCSHQGNIQTGEKLMKKFIAIAAVIVTTAGLSACNSPGERAVGGALIGGGAGALIGGAVTGSGRGALVGGALGAAGGAIVGAGTAPQGNGCPRQAPYLRYDAYGQAFCSRR